MRESWRFVFRRGLAPQLPTEALEALRRGMTVEQVAESGESEEERLLVRFDPPHGEWL